VIQPVLSLHECVAKLLQDAVDSVADPTVTEAAAKFAAEPLHSATGLASSGAALTETFFLCVRF
jgi:hypothetical protein